MSIIDDFRYSDLDQETALERCGIGGFFTAGIFLALFYTVLSQIIIIKDIHNIDDNLLRFILLFGISALLGLIAMCIYYFIINLIYVIVDNIKNKLSENYLGKLKLLPEEKVYHFVLNKISKYIKKKENRESFIKTSEYTIPIDFAIDMKKYDLIPDSSIEELGNIGSIDAIPSLRNIIKECDTSKSNLASIALLSIKSKNMKKKDIAIYIDKLLKGKDITELLKSIKTVNCSNCGKKVKQINVGVYESILKMQQWLANVCIKCRRIYCSECMKLGEPTKCPICGEETKPALRMILEEIKVL